MKQAMFEQKSCDIRPVFLLFVFFGVGAVTGGHRGDRSRERPWYRSKGFGPTDRSDLGPHGVGGSHTVPPKTIPTQ